LWGKLKKRDLLANVGVGGRIYIKTDLKRTEMENVD
jgi:hypothetical protein